MKKYIFLMVVLGGIVISLQNCNISTANISNVKVCENAVDNNCPQDAPIFEVSTPYIFCTCKVNNAPSGTPVKFSWFYLGDEKILIDEVIINTPDGGTTFNMQSNLSIPNAGWPKGNYEVVIGLEADNSTPVTKSFKVE